MSTDDKHSVSMGCSVGHAVCPSCPPGVSGCEDSFLLREEDTKFFAVSVVSTPRSGASVFQFDRAQVIDHDPPPSQVFSPSDIEAAKVIVNTAEVETHLDRFLHAVKGAQFVMYPGRVIRIDRWQDGLVTIRIAPVVKEAP